MGELSPFDPSKKEVGVDYDVLTQEELRAAAPYTRLRIVGGIPDAPTRASQAIIDEVSFIKLGDDHPERWKSGRIFSDGWFEELADGGLAPAVINGSQRTDQSVRVGEAFDFATHFIVDPDDASLAEVLKEAGYTVPDWKLPADGPVYERLKREDLAAVCGPSGKLHLRLNRSKRALYVASIKVELPAGE